MQNYVQPGATITLAAPYAVTSGDGLLVGAIFGVASTDAALGEAVEACLVGVYDLKKVGSQAWAAGDKVYWDDTAKETTKTATANTLIGVAVEAVGSGADDTTGRVRLNGQRRVTAFAAATDILFADPHLARDAVWRPGGTGDGVPVRVIARRPDRLVDFAGARIISATALFDLRVAEAPGIAEGDSLEVDGEVFVVQGVPQRDAERLVWTVETRPA